MKKSIITIITIMFTVTAFAQFTNKGTVILGGSSNLGLNFLSNKGKFGDGDFQDGSKLTSFSLSPQAGYFFMNNFAAGLSIDVNSSKNKADNFEATSSFILVGPFARYYMEKFYFEGTVGLGSAKSESTFSEGISKDFLTGWSLGAGYAVMLSDAVALEPQINYTSISAKDDDFVNRTGGLSVNLSLFVYLSK
ncbi:MAG: outer membrane beta-barrel protein [Cytophagales bacterium]|nr:outer membrane beta-barrel protein [Cytophagales bacterium]